MIQAISETRFIAEASQATRRARSASCRTARGRRSSSRGATADFVDFQDSLTDHLPIAFGIIVVATLVILFLMTGSVVLPVKSLLMNVLNLSAVFGLLVLIFQDGRLEGVARLLEPGGDRADDADPALRGRLRPLDRLRGVPALADQGGARRRRLGLRGVAIGLERTGRIVTAAALLFAIAIGAFATSEIIFIKQNGVGTALAVLIDATIIRALLVPSLMELLGKWNWWAPAPLRRLHERIGLSEGGLRGTARGGPGARGRTLRA